MTPAELTRFAEKYQLARDAALQSQFDRGTAGMEVEWNVVDADFRPVMRVGNGDKPHSFAEALRSRFVPSWLRTRNDLEVFHWMTEWITKPYYHPLGPVFEARVLEGCLLNSLNGASLSLGKELFACHGNVLWPIEVGYDCIPEEWELAKRRYLQRCVDLFGSSLATAGVHANISLPDPLLSLDYLHQPVDDRTEDSLVNYRNAAYIRGTRILRAFAALFIATTASTPMRGEMRDGAPVVLLTDQDSNRLAQFPNPAQLDVPNLYRSYRDYVDISTDLIRRRIRFGNNNWTPTRARSDPDSINHIIHLTTDQLHEVSLKGIYGVREDDAVERLARLKETENMLARLALPMIRVEVRTDEGGHDLALDIANLTLKHLLLIWTYGDASFGASFEYDANDVERARRNESSAAHDGMRGEIVDPFTGKTVAMRDFLRWTLDQVLPLARELGWAEMLQPLEAIAGGAMNTAEKLRNRLERHCNNGVVPISALRELVLERRQQVAADVEEVIGRVKELGPEEKKLRDLIVKAADSADDDPSAPVDFQPPLPVSAETLGGDKTAEIVALAQRLIGMRSVTNCPNERLEDVHRAARFIAGYLRDAGLNVQFFEQGKYPAVVASFPDQLTVPVTLSGHFDVVPPSPDDSQFEPMIEGNYLWGRGAADMKTVVATYLVWMKDVRRRMHGKFPPINLMLIGNEENGEGEPCGTPHVLAELKKEYGYEPSLLIAGERTGEKGDELFGEICIENRGVVRVELSAHGEQMHTGVGKVVADLGERIVQARGDVQEMLAQYLTLSSKDGWHTDFRFPYITVGEAGVYNITAASGHLGLEIRPIPQDDVAGLLEALRKYAEELDLVLRVDTKEPGVACDPQNPYLLTLIDAVRDISGDEPQIGKKKPGTSGRFAPRGQAVIWGQTGIGPHTPKERHYIPSIKGYYDCLDRYAELLMK